MSKEQMIYVIRNGLVHTLQTKYRKQVMEFAFGKDFIKALFFSVSQENAGKEPLSIASSTLSSYEETLSVL